MIPDEPSQADVDRLLRGLAKCPECSGCGHALRRSPSGIVFHGGNWADPPEEPEICETCSGRAQLLFWKDDIIYVLGYSYVWFEVIGFQHAESEVVPTGSFLLA